MNRTVQLAPDATFFVKPALAADQDLHLSLTPLHDCGLTVPGTFRIACRVRGDSVQALPLTIRTAASALRSPRAGTLIQEALRQGADVFVFGGVYEAATFTVRAVDLHVQPGKAALTREHAEQRSLTLQVRLDDFLRRTLDQLLPEAGTPVTLDSGRTVQVLHLLSSDPAEEAVIVLCLDEPQGLPAGQGSAHGGFDARRAPDFIQALRLDQAFQGRDSSDAQASVAYDPETGLLQAEVYNDPLEVPLDAADRAGLALAVLGAFTCTPQLVQEPQDDLVAAQSGLAI